MPLKEKSKDKRKAPQVGTPKPETQTSPTKFMVSAIFYAKPIKSWYEVVVVEEKATKLSQVQTDSIQH